MAEQSDDLGAPRVLQQFVGQRHVVEQVQVALDSTSCSGKSLPHMLLTGPAGTGKTEMCKLIARETGTDLQMAMGQSFKNGGSIIGFLMSAHEKDILFIDEIHELRREPQTVLLRALSERIAILSGPAFDNIQVVQLPRFSLLAATTDEHTLVRPLRERFALTLAFDYYTRDELAQILHHRIRHLRWQVEPVVCDLIARRSHGVAREAMRLLDWCWRLAESRGLSVTTAEHVLETCRLQRIDEMGLNQVHRNYLQLLAADSPLKPGVLAMRLGLPMETVRKVIEPLLVREGLVEIQTLGRILTAAGEAHIRASRSLGDCVPVSE